VTHDFIERRIEAARVEDLAGFYLLPAIPPMGSIVIKEILPLGLDIPAFLVCFFFAALVN
jgi:hypothetical protein